MVDGKVVPSIRLASDSPFQRNHTLLIVCLLLVVNVLPALSDADTGECVSTTDASLLSTELPLLSPFGSYPNPLRLTDQDRQLFHPVVEFPTIQQDEVQIPNVRILDFTKPWEQAQLATEDDRIKCRQLLEQRQRKQEEEGDSYYRDCLSASSFVQERGFGIGRYDEDRVGMYTSDMYTQSNNKEDTPSLKYSMLPQIGYHSLGRTIHVGIDLDGPLHTPVHAFWHGTIHSAGYNADLGDYGNVVVVRHVLPKNMDNDEERVVYALYGHLDQVTVAVEQQWKPGEAVARGDVIGRMGGIHENGGWMIPHVHFQLCIFPPITHDLPGAVSLKDRPRAMQEFPDPRYVLGPLY